MTYNKLKATDKMLVNRGDNSYSVTVADVKNGDKLKDDDQFLVNRGGNSYRISKADLQSEIGGSSSVAPPTIIAASLTQDQTNANRFTDNSFTTTVTATESPILLQMNAEVVGALSIEAGSAPIATNAYPGSGTTIPLTLIGDSSDTFSVGDVVQANEANVISTSPITGIEGESVVYTPVSGSAEGWKGCLEDPFNSSTYLTTGTTGSVCTFSPPLEVSTIEYRGEGLPLDGGGQYGKYIFLNDASSAPPWEYVDGSSSKQRATFNPPLMLTKITIGISSSSTGTSGFIFDGQAFPDVQGTTELTFSNNDNLKYFAPNDVISGGAVIKNIYPSDSKMELANGPFSIGGVVTASKRGSGTIKSISGNYVEIGPFTDNCFVEGQWLTKAGPITVTPKSSNITDIITDISNYPSTSGVINTTANAWSPIPSYTGGEGPFDPSGSYYAWKSGQPLLTVPCNIQFVDSDEVKFLWGGSASYYTGNFVRFLDADGEIVCEGEYGTETPSTLKTGLATQITVQGTGDAIYSGGWNGTRINGVNIADPQPERTITSSALEFESPDGLGNFKNFDAVQQDSGYDAESDTITDVSGTAPSITLTLSGNTDLDVFQPGDIVDNQIGPTPGSKWSDYLFIQSPYDTFNANPTEQAPDPSSDEKSPSMAFDGLTSTEYCIREANGWIYFNPPAIKGVTKLRISTRYSAGVYLNGAAAFVDGTPAGLAGASPVWFEVTAPPSEITQIAVKGASGGYWPRICAIEINDKVLLDTDIGTSIVQVGPGDQIVVDGGNWSDGTEPVDFKAGPTDTVVLDKQGIDIGDLFYVNLGLNKASTAIFTVLSAGVLKVTLASQAGAPTTSGNNFSITNTKTVSGITIIQYEVTFTAAGVVNFEFPDSCTLYAYDQAGTGNNDYCVFWNDNVVSTKKGNLGNPETTGETTVTCSYTPATGVVSSIDPIAETMTLTSSDDTYPKRWLANKGKYVVGPERNAVEMKAYLNFDQLGQVSSLLSYKPTATLMNNIVTPTLQFPDTFTTGEAPDTELPYPTYLRTIVSSGNALGYSPEFKSNVLYPAKTGTYTIPSNSYRVLRDEFKQFCKVVTTNEYRVAKRKVEKGQQMAEKLQEAVEAKMQDYLRQ